MIKKLAIAIFSLTTAGCFFGGDSDTDTTTAPTGSEGSAKHITPGIYSAEEYSELDSNWVGLESEFILDASGDFQHFYVLGNEARFETRGKWVQKDSAFYFGKMEETEDDLGTFDFFTSREDDTNAVMQVTDTSFMRREWTPLRQKPYWITYHRRSFPSVKEGLYQTTWTDTEWIDTSDIKVVAHSFKVSIKGDTYTLTHEADGVEDYQKSAKYSQIGSFLAIDEMRERYTDSTNTYTEWVQLSGTNLARMESVTDASFHLWWHSDFPNPGYWDTYNKIAAD